MSSRLTASRVRQAELCAASTALPAVHEHSDAANAGTEIHRYIAELARRPANGPYIFSSPEIRDRCTEMDTGALFSRHSSADRFEAEIAFAWDFRTGKARELGTNLDRDYGPLASTEIAGACDLFSVSDGTIRITDVKTGSRHHVQPARENRQLQTLAVLASRALGIDRVIAELAFLGADGSFTFDTAEWDLLDLDGFAAELRRIAERVESVRQLVAAGGMPDVYPADEQCRFCAAFKACPAKTALVRQALAEPVKAGDKQLTNYEAAETWTKLMAAESLLKRVRGELEEYARVSPFSLSSGAVVREVEVKREFVDAAKALPVLERYQLTDVVVPSATKSAIEKRLRQLGRSAEIGDVFGEIRAANAMDVTTHKTVREMKP